MPMRTIGFLALPLALTACTTSGDGYPSLLPRPIETRDGAEPMRPDPVAAPDPALEARIAGILASAEKNAVRFNTLSQESEARVAIARGVAIGSERWITAQMSLATLSRTRGETVAMASELEIIASERIRAGIAPFPSLTKAEAILTKQVEVQTARVQALENALAK